MVNIAEYMNTKYIEDQFILLLKVTKAVNQICIQQLNWPQRLQKNEIN